MKPSVIANANATSGTAAGNGANDMSQTTNLPINHEYGAGGGNVQQPSQQYYNYGQHPHQQPQHQYSDGYGSPRTQAYASQPHETPSHFQLFDDHDMYPDMFPMSRLSRMNDTFPGFGTRKRSSFHDPQNTGNAGFYKFFNDDPGFGFPEFGTIGRRRAAAAADPMSDEHDFFNRLPSEFRQFMPEDFAHRRHVGGGNVIPTQTSSNPYQQQPTNHQHHPGHPQGGYYSSGYVPSGSTPPTANIIPQSPSKKLCDAAIQTEDPNLSQGRSEIDGCGGFYAPSSASSTSGQQMQPDNLNHHGLRNTVDMGIKSAVENEIHGPRSHSAPPPEQQQQNQQHFQQQKIPLNGQRNTPPPSSNMSSASQYTSQNTPPSSAGVYQQHQQPSGYYQKTYYPPQQHSHPSQQKQQTPPPPQTPGGSYVRTIPIFVEGRQEPIINSHKEIPNQNGSNTTSNASAQASARAFTPPHQQQQQTRNYPHHQQQQHPQQAHSNRPAPFNTQQAQQHPQQHQQQQQPQQQSSGLPPQTPHTMDSINKIQDIQRDVLDLMAQVEKFKGTRQDKDYVYLDEMLTRNLLKLDTIDTNGKESIRLARKEAIKCIQASINVLEAKAEENRRASLQNSGDNKKSNSSSNIGRQENSDQQNSQVSSSASASSIKDKDKDKENNKKESANSPRNSKGDILESGEEQPADISGNHEAIPLPPPESMQEPAASESNDSKSEGSTSPQQTDDGMGASNIVATSETPANLNKSSSVESSNKINESK